jgi:hypothetical protein
LDSRSAGDPSDLGTETEVGGLNGKGVLALVVALLVPGAGHLMLGRWRRAIAIAVILLGTFAFGLWLEGRVYVPSRAILPLFYAFGDAGLGLIYAACLITDIGLQVHADQATFEYGSNLMLVAGLLNYLVALDAYDIAVGRKP